MLKKIFCSLILCALSLLSSNGYARSYNLTLVDDKARVEIPLEEIRKLADLELIIYEPFLKKHVNIKGILLDDLLNKYLPNKELTQLTFIAIDGYETQFNTWQKDHWVIVTHEDGKALTVRTKGPLKVIEKDHIDKKSKNLREFNDWIWMLKEIKVKP